MGEGGGQVSNLPLPGWVGLGLAGLLKAGLGEEVGGLGGGDVVGGSLSQDALDGVVDSFGLLAG